VLLKERKCRSTRPREEALSMREAMQIRLEELKGELEKGEAEVQRVEARRAQLHETLLRIGGAAQALQELLSKDQAAEAIEPNSVVGGEQTLAAAQKERVGAQARGT
jgi:predicted nuclease with TOPRIM domain